MAQSSSNASSEAGEQAMYALFAKWQILDQVTAQMFAIAISSLIIVVIILHWGEIIFYKHYNKEGTFRSRARSVIRPIERLHGPKVIWGYTIHPGRLHLIFSYIGINIVMFIHDHPEKAPMAAIVSKRFGWLALCNMCLAVFLGLKNTPLSPLTGHSFEAINVLHRFCGYTTVLLVVLHATTYLSALAKDGALVDVMSRSRNIAGGTAGIFMVLIFLTANGFARRRLYEVFYKAHVVLVAAILLTVGLHRPDISLKAAIITIVAGTMWSVDIYLRLVKWMSFGFSNYCKLTPLPDEATRVTMRRSVRAQPGSFAFLWIPSVKRLQRHPFTLVHGKPNAEFVVKAQNDFTRDLYDAACKEPGKKLRAAIEGPYGNIPNANDYGKVVLIAGGSGVTFAMSMALQWQSKRRTPKDKSSLDLVWVVRHRANFEWFRNELYDLKANKRVNVQLYVSGPNHEQYVTHLSPSSTSSDPDNFGNANKAKEAQTNVVSRSPSKATLPSSIRGRPDVLAIVSNAVVGQTPDDRVLVMGCGPDELLTSIGMAVAANTVVDAPSIKMHLEKYSL